MDNQTEVTTLAESSGTSNFTDLVNLTTTVVSEIAISSTEVPMTVAATIGRENMTSVVPDVIEVTANLNATTIATAFNVTTQESITEQLLATTTSAMMIDPFSAELRHALYVSACWQLTIAVVTIGFAIVIAIYGPVVFGSRALVRGMDVATEFLEFFLPIKYQGAPAEQKMLHYSEEQFVSKIRRFAAFIGLAMTIDALFEFMSGCLGRSGFHEDSVPFTDYDGMRGAFACMCILNGLFTFCLFVASIQLFRKGFLREMCLVYAIRNAIACFIFTSAWSDYFDFDSRVNSAMDSVSSAVDGMSNMINGDS